MKKDGVVPEGIYRVPIGKGVYRRRGRDVTIVGVSHAIELGMQAAGTLAAEGIDAEVVDLRTVKPLDEAIVLESLQKTGRLVVVDTAWMKGGLCAEVGCLAAEKGFAHLKAPVAPGRPARHPDARRIHARTVLLSGRGADCRRRASRSSAHDLRARKHQLGTGRARRDRARRAPPASSPWARRSAASSAPSPIASASITPS